MKLRVCQYGFFIGIALHLSQFASFYQQSRNHKPLSLPSFGKFLPCENNCSALDNISNPTSGYIKPTRTKHCPTKDQKKVASRMEYCRQTSMTDIFCMDQVQ